MTVLEFEEQDGIHTSIGQSGRRWTITRSLTGWRLQFLDAGDTAPTNAGNHRTLGAAKLEAGR